MKEDSRESLESRAKTEDQDKKVTLALVDFPDYKVPVEMMDFLVVREMLDALETQDHLDYQDRMDVLDYLE